jgi:hypothetical protein
MKKITAILLGTLIASSAALASTNQVLSRNAVGYVKVDAPAGLNMVSVDFQEISGGNFSVTNLIGNQLPSGSSVFIWDRASSTYRQELRTRSGWSPGTNIISRGQGMFIQSPSATSLFFMGEVPDSSTAPSTTLANVTGLGMLSYPYPVDVAWTNTQLAQSGVSGDSLIVWDVDTQGYVQYLRTRSGWGAATNLVLKPGQAFWFSTSTNINWIVNKPYAWP